MKLKMPTFSAGPWESSAIRRDNSIYCGNATKVFQEEIEVYAKDDGHDEESHPGPIAYVNAQDHGVNAKLIKASPDLFAACAIALVWICNHSDGHRRKFLECADILEAALRKAGAE